MSKDIWDLHDSGDPGPAGLGWGTLLLWVVWGGDPLDSPSARPSEGPTEGGNEGPRGATSQLRLGHRGESGADRALACKLLRTSKK